MQAIDKRQEADGLPELRERIDLWRRTRGKPGRMPENLWRAAAKLAEKHGIHRVAAPLRLDYYSLKRWVDEGRRELCPVAPRP